MSKADWGSKFLNAAKSVRITEIRDVTAQASEQDGCCLLNCHWSTSIDDGGMAWDSMSQAFNPCWNPRREGCREVSADDRDTILHIAIKLKRNDLLVELASRADEINFTAENQHGETAFRAARRLGAEYEKLWRAHGLPISGESVAWVVFCEHQHDTRDDCGYVVCTTLGDATGGSFEVPPGEDPFGEWLAAKVLKSLAKPRGTHLRLIKHGATEPFFSQEDVARAVSSKEQVGGST